MSHTNKASTKPQYQHYIPQFVLRKFSYFERPNREDHSDEKAYKRASVKAKDKARINILDFDNEHKNVKLNRYPVSKTNGIPDMYDPEIEKGLGLLEDNASKIIAKIEADFMARKSTTTLTRSQKDILRRFIFIMMYRNRTFHKRFACAEGDYNSADRATFLPYMQKNGFERPKDVWLSNIRAFLNVDLAVDDIIWCEWLTANAYPPDAMWFSKNMTSSYLCFCSPPNPEEEFVLTQNAYSIFEGPNSDCGWTDWHTFHLINPKLMIILRSGALPGDTPGLRQDLQDEMSRSQRHFVDLHNSMYTDPSTVNSCLQDLPVTRPVPSYLVMQNTGLFNITKKADDTFTFTFFFLNNQHFQLITTIFFEEALQTNIIAYKTPAAFRRALEFYLELDDTSFKKAIKPEDAKLAEMVLVDRLGRELTELPPLFRCAKYLSMLERAAHNLGSTCVTKFSYVTLRANNLTAPFSIDVGRRYKLLGYDDLISTWLADLEQALAISRLWFLINHLTRHVSLAIRNRVQRSRVDFISGLAPRRVWLHLRVMRMYVDHPATKVNEWLETLFSEGNDGPEDVIVDVIGLFKQNAVSRAMLYASGMRQFNEIRSMRPEALDPMEYYLAAWNYVGNISQCGIPPLELAALVAEAKLSRDPVFTSDSYPSSPASETFMSIFKEIYVRQTVLEGFKRLLDECGEEKAAIESLQVVVFGLLYPIEF